VEVTMGTSYGRDLEATRRAAMRKLGYLSALVVGFLAHGALAQESATHYIDYPVLQEKV